MCPDSMLLSLYSSTGTYCSSALYLCGVRRPIQKSLFKTRRRVLRLLSQGYLAPIMEILRMSGALLHLQRGDHEQCGHIKDGRELVMQKSRFSSVSDRPVLSFGGIKEIGNVETARAECPLLEFGSVGEVRNLG